MKDPIGNTYSVVSVLPPIAGCTVSKAVQEQITHFALASETDISAESYPQTSMYIGSYGMVQTVVQNEVHGSLASGDFLLVPGDWTLGFTANQDSVYTEINLGKGALTMNSIIKPGEVMKLKDLVPYGEGTIVNMDLVKTDSMKFVIMAFDEGCALSEHAAPGEAMIFALDGKGVIGYEGVDHPIQAGENFVFAKGGLHSVKADGKFKMALLLLLK